MWQRFTERARKVIFYAQEEAGRLGDNYVSTEHILLGLIRDNDNVASRILDRLGLSLGKIRSEIESLVIRGSDQIDQEFQLTPRAKKVIDLAYDEARQLANDYIGTEHLLLGTIREGEGMAAVVLTKLGVSLSRTRTEVKAVQEHRLSSMPHNDSHAQHLVGLAAEANQTRSSEVTAVIHRAAELSARDHAALGLDHILFSILDDPKRIASKALAKLGVTQENLLQALNEVMLSNHDDSA